MENSNKHLWFGFGGLILGSVIVMLISQGGVISPRERRVENYQERGVVSEINSDDHMHSAMKGMMMGLSNLAGTQFDQAFINQMIIHHEGAIEMAEAALVNAERQEIKDLAEAIIEAQTQEIEQMKSWRAD